ncbi:hypothetical protein GJAV_G00225740 [Gymnothorax javanicus]|nr:hypothetical protein GJAV_G00225740 [Gymnothorax javanicus]
MSGNGNPCPAHVGGFPVPHYPYFFPHMLGGLSPPALQGLPVSGYSTPSPAMPTAVGDFTHTVPVGFDAGLAERERSLAQCWYRTHGIGYCGSPSGSLSAVEPCAHAQYAPQSRRNVPEGESRRYPWPSMLGERRGMTRRDPASRISGRDAPHSCESTVPEIRYRVPPQFPAGLRPPAKRVRNTGRYSRFSEGVFRSPLYARVV